jgi:hypothetical protein
MTDGRLRLACVAAVVVLSAWPLFIVDLPPYQDVPNHLATVHVMTHPDLYPEFVSNGWFKTNTALSAWLYGPGRWLGPTWGMRIFLLGLLAATAIGYQRLVRELSGRGADVTASLFLVPMVHNWFVSMGMLNFALAQALALFLLASLGRQLRAPTGGGAIAIALLGVATWWAHVVPLLLVILLVGIELLLTARRSWVEARRFAVFGVAPLVPVTLLLLARQAAVSTGAMRPTPTPWNLLYDLWAKYFYAFTILSVTSLVPCLVLAFVALRAFKKPVPLFSPIALGALAALYIFLPESYAAFFYLNTRIVPFIWVALLVRVPERLSRPVTAVLVLASVLYSASLGIDFVRLTHDQEAFCAGIGAVPARARLFPVILERKGTAVNTFPLLQSWGRYVVAKDTAAPLLFAEQPTFALRYQQAPPDPLAAVAIEQFEGSHASLPKFCAELRENGTRAGDCRAQFRQQWTDFFDVVRPRFDHLLVWGASSDVRDVIPSDYRVIFERGPLLIYARSAAAAAPEGANTP